MSAPGALAMSKMLYPEMQKSRFSGKNKKQPEKMDAANIVEAASNGASQAIPLVANIAAMLIAFVSFIEWLNSAVAWAGECVGQGESSLSCKELEPCWLKWAVLRKLCKMTVHLLSQNS